jgi:hypothetical protein
VSGKNRQPEGKKNYVEPQLHRGTHHTTAPAETGVSSTAQAALLALRMMLISVPGKIRAAAIPLCTSILFSQISENSSPKPTKRSPVTSWRASPRGPRHRGKFVCLHRIPAPRFAHGRQSKPDLEYPCTRVEPSRSRRSHPEFRRPDDQDWHKRVSLKRGTARA